MDGSIFKHDGILGRIFPGFMWDSHSIESHWNYQGIQM